MSNLPPLKEVDKDLGDTVTTELSFEKCNHKFYVVSSTEIRCSKCPIGFTGHNVIDIIKAQKNS